MVLQIKREEIPPDIILLQVSGKLVLGRDAKELEWAFDDLVRAKNTKIILDFSNLNFIDSTGVGVVVMCSGKVKEAGGELRLTGCHGLVAEVLRKTRVDSLVSFCESRDHAVQSLNATFKAGAGGAQQA